jgi:UDP-N-acetylmuramate dehydrogenase
MEAHVPLERYTTIGTGGPARFFARPQSLDELVDLLRWAAAGEVEVETIGLGSNLLVADAGVDALVLKLSGALAAVRVEGDTLVAGGGAPNAVALHRAREAGLGGFEFASAIPGTAGGGVRMNAGAYGCDWRAVLIDAVVVDGAGARTLAVDELGLSYRHSLLGRGQVVARVRFQLEARSPEEVKARVAELLAQRKATQPTNKRTFGSVFKNPSSGPGAGQLIEASAELRSRRATPTSSRTRPLRRPPTALPSWPRRAASSARVLVCCWSTRCSFSGSSSCRGCREGAV